jgi:N-acetylglucosaminyldiphosphoundecaprenol N-acetyl-beta-D-mannosaminyltransferase
MQAIPRFNVLGVGISAVNLSQACAAVMAALAGHTKGYVSTADARVVNLAAEQPDFRDRLNASLLTTPDGMPLVWLGRRLGHRHVDRVYGPDLMLAVCAATVDTGHTHYLYGGVPGAAAELRDRLDRRFPGIRVVGCESPPRGVPTAAEVRDLGARVAALKPDLFWVGLGVPMRERFMADHLPGFDTTVMLGVGAAFEFLAGRVRQAPRWVQRSGFEWLFRLGVEPRRLGPRYLRHLPLFVLRVAAQSIGLRPPGGNVR